jgi:hypothetical protein
MNVRLYTSLATGLYERPLLHRVCHEEKLAPLPMGNTISIEPNVLIFPPPPPSKRNRSVSVYGPGSTHSSGPVHDPSSRSTTHTTGPAYIPTTLPIPPKPQSEFTIIRPYMLRRHPTKLKSAKEAHLAVYTIPLASTPQILSLPTSLTTSPRTPTDRATHPALVEHGWLPRALFHTSGDFQNDFSNSLISVFLTNSETKRSREGGEETTLGSHRFVHVFDAKHLAQGFDAVLKDLCYKGLASRVEVDVSGEEVSMMEACAITVVQSWVKRRSEEGGVETKMVEQLEGLLWGVWLEGWGEKEKRMGSGCVPS